MFILAISTYVLAALCLSPVSGHRHHRRQDDVAPLVVSESVIPITGGQAIPTPTADPAPLVTVAAGPVQFKTNTTLADSSEITADTVAETIKSTALIFARDQASSYSASSVFNDHGIPYEVVIVPQEGVTLPVLNSTATDGNYGLIVVVSEVSYYYPAANGYSSALKSPQWAALFAYQTAFGVRMVRLDAYPSADTGTVALGACCGFGVEQYVSISDNSKFKTAGLKVGAQLSTAGLYHYPAAITNSSVATEVVQFASNSQFQNTSTGAVINDFGGRQQMVFFIGFATDWSLTSNVLTHAWLNWATRGLYTGYRRTIFLTQIDDMFLESDIYSPAGFTYRIGPSDLAAHISFMATINSKLNPGSEWWIEIGHNGNGNIEASDNSDPTGGNLCKPGPIEYNDQIDTPLEFQKPPGTGNSIWPATAGAYPNFSVACLLSDPLLVWWAIPTNLNAFSHVSHTFTHEDQNNATYSDIYKEINWNQKWLAASGIASAAKFSGSGLIPPAITGLHNGDALQAWSENGVIHAVGDNTRPALLNPNNEHWPLMTTLAANGFDGMQVTPRWATNIYYNCDNPDCTVLEWINTSGGSGDINALLAVEKQTNVRHLMELHHDPFMFHQANLRYDNAASYTINGVTSKLSLFQAWVETITQEFVRLVEWPLVTKKHDDVGALFRARMNRDACGASLSYLINPTAETITGVRVSTANACSEAIPVTVPGSVTDTQGFPTEQLGSDPLTIWVTLSGSPVTFTLTAPIPL